MHRQKHPGRSLDLARRHLDRAQKRDLIAAQIKDTPTVSSRQIAAGLGVSPTSVASVRSELEESGTVSTVDTIVGKDGVVQPARKPKPARAANRRADAAGRPKNIRRSPVRDDVSSERGHLVPGAGTPPPKLSLLRGQFPPKTAFDGPRSGYTVKLPGGVGKRSAVPSRARAPQPLSAGTCHALHRLAMQARSRYLPASLPLDAIHVAALPAHGLQRHVLAGCATLSVALRMRRTELVRTEHAPAFTFHPTNVRRTDPHWRANRDLRLRLLDHSK